MFVAFRNDSFYMCPARMLSKLYSNSLLAVSQTQIVCLVKKVIIGYIQLLNARMRIVGGRNHDSPSSYDATLSVMTTSDARFPTRGTDILPNHNLVNIHISHQVDRDDDAFKMDTVSLFEKLIISRLKFAFRLPTMDKLSLTKLAMSHESKRCSVRLTPYLFFHLFILCVTFMTLDFFVILKHVKNST